MILSAYELGIPDCESNKDGINTLATGFFINKYNFCSILSIFQWNIVIFYFVERTISVVFVQQQWKALTCNILYLWAIEKAKI